MISRSASLKLPKLALSHLSETVGNGDGSRFEGRLAVNNQESVHDVAAPCSEQNMIRQKAEGWRSSRMESGKAAELFFHFRFHFRLDASPLGAERNVVT